MEQKTYKTYRQLLNKLRSRGMVINKGSQGSRVMRILEQENYYNVINGYKALFLEREATATVDEKYKDGTTFDEVYALYCFDREVRNAIAIIFAILLSKTDLREFVSAMKSSFAKLDKQLHTISVEDIMETMGYHKDWQNLILLKK